MADAWASRNWPAANRLVEGGATTTLVDAATLGPTDRLEGFFAETPGPSVNEISRALWGACHGGQQPAAQYLLDSGR